MFWLALVSVLGSWIWASIFILRFTCESFINLVGIFGSHLRAFFHVLWLKVGRWRDARLHIGTESPAFECTNGGFRAVKFPINKFVSEIRRNYLHCLRFWPTIFLLKNIGTSLRKTGENLQNFLRILPSFLRIFTNFPPQFFSEQSLVM